MPELTLSELAKLAFWRYLFLLGRLGGPEDTSERECCELGKRE